MIVFERRMHNIAKSTCFFSTISIARLDPQQGAQTEKKDRELNKEDLERKTTAMQDTKKNEKQKIDELRNEIAENKKEYRATNEEYKQRDNELTELKTNIMQLKKSRAENDKIHADASRKRAQEEAPDCEKEKDPSARKIAKLLSE